MATETTEPAGPPRTLVAWCPDWPVTAAGYRPDQPVAVVAAGLVTVCSAAARAGGVRRGQRIRRAQQDCPDLLLVPADEARDAAVFETVVTALERVVPGVEVIRPGVCAARAAGASRFYGGEDEAAVAVVDAVSAAIAGLGQTGGDHAGQVRCWVGVADGLFAAELAARRGLVVAPGGSAAFLADWPIAVLGQSDLVAAVRRLGITTLGQFAALPAGRVQARFGLGGTRAHELASGAPERDLVARVPPPELAVREEYTPVLAATEAVTFAAKRLATRLRAQLVARNLVCLRLRIRADLLDQDGRVHRLERVWRLDRVDPLWVEAAVAERTRWQLTGWLAGPAPDRSGADPQGETGIGALSLIPLEVSRADPTQLRLDGEPAAAAAEQQASDRASRAVARLQGLLGPDAVRIPVVEGGRSPVERARWTGWESGPADRVPARPPTDPWPGALPPPAPAAVCLPPLPARVEDAAGRAVTVSGDGELSADPAALVLAGQRLALTGWAGPWPVDQRWWDPATARRRARLQLVADAGGAWLAAVESGRWWIEAIYD